MEASTPYFETTFSLVRNIRSMQVIELFITCLGLPRICGYPADDVTKFIS